MNKPDSTCGKAERETREAEQRVTRLVGVIEDWNRDGGHRRSKGALKQARAVLSIAEMHLELARDRLRTQAAH